MGNGGSKASGGGSRGSNGSKGDSICGIDRRDIRSITHEYTSDKSKTVTICITSKGVTDCFSTHYRESYPSGNSNSTGGEGRVTSSNSSGSSSNTTSSSYNDYVTKAINLNQFLHTKYIPQDVIGTTGNSNKIYNGTHSEETMKVINFIQTQSYNKGWGSSALYHGPGGIEGSYRATVINLAYTDMYDLDLCNLGVLLRDYNLELDSILLQGNKLTAKHIPELISGITSVRHQTICEYVGRSKVFKEWHGHLTVQHVKYLNISNNQIGDEGASIFAEAIKTGRFTHLKSLNLADNNITDIGAKVLADSLTTGNYNSKTLRLEGNKITDEGVSYYLDNLKKDQLNNTYVSLTTSKNTIQNIVEFFGKGAKYYVSEYEKAQQSSKEADIAVNGKDGFGHCVQVARTAGIDVATAMAQKAIAMPPIVKKVVEKSPAPVKLIVGGGLVVSSLNEVKGAFLSEDFAYCMAWFNQEIIGDNGHENSDI